MKPFFVDPARQAALVREVKEWEGTPFLDGAGGESKKGTKCDCGGWLAAALQAVGAIGVVPWPKRYVSQNGGPDMLALMLDVLGRVERLEKIWHTGAGKAPDLLTGDIIVATTGKAHHHMVLYIGDNRVMHCWGGKVQEGSSGDSVLVKHMHAIYRPIANDEH